VAGTIADIKKEFLRLLEEDEEFRYAVAAKIGLLEILQKLEEHDRKFNEILAELREHRKILEQHSKRLEEHDRKFNEIIERLDRHEMEIKRIWEKLEEHDRKFNEILAELREHRKKLEEHDRRFDEIIERLDRHERILEKHTEILRRHSQMLGALGNDIGALTEATLSMFVRNDIVDELKLKGAEIVEIERMYKVNDYEVDLYIETIDEIIVVEVKTRPSIGDVERLCRIRDYLLEKKGKRIRPILVSLRAKTTLDIVKRAKEDNVKLIVY